MHSYALHNYKFIPLKKGKSMILSPFDEFKSFMDKVIDPSLDELEKLEEVSRKHIQKLVYTNLLDRFDSTVDAMFLKNVRHPSLIQEALRDANEPITQAELYEILLHEDGIEGVLTEKLREGMSNSIVRNNHAQKVSSLFRLCVESSGVHNKKPRVNISTGAILDKIKPQKVSKIPYTIIGYCDWLYARRNSIVHGSGSSSFLDRDKVRISKSHGVNVASKFMIKVGSIRSTRKFYSDLVDIFCEAV